MTLEVRAGNILNLTPQETDPPMTFDDCDHVPPVALTAREVCQVLREVVFGRRTMAKVGNQSWGEVYACHFDVDIEGWRVTLYNDCDALDYCEHCVSPDGNHWAFDPGDRTDPIALLSTWEHQCLERMLKAL
jgi:hypothetical protein